MGRHLIRENFRFFIVRAIMIITILDCAEVIFLHVFLIIGEILGSKKIAAWTLRSALITLRNDFWLSQSHLYSLGCEIFLKYGKICGCIVSLYDFLSLYYLLLRIRLHLLLIKFLFLLLNYRLVVIWVYQLWRDHLLVNLYLFLLRRKIGP